MSVTIVATGAAADAVDRIVPQLVSDGVASGITAQDADALGSGRRGGVGQAPRLDRGGRRLRGRSSTTSSPCATKLRRRDGVDHIVLGGMGGSSLAPEVITRTYGVDADRARLDRPRRRCAPPSPTGSSTTAVVDLVEVRLDRRDRQPEARLRAGVPRRRASTRSSASSSSPTPARRSTSPLAPTATASSTPTRTSAAATRRSPPSASCRPASPASTSASCSTRPESMPLELALDTDENPGLVLGAAIAGTAPLQGQARHRRRRHAHRRLRRLGRAAHRRVDRQARQGPPARRARRRLPRAQPRTWPTCRSCASSATSDDTREVAEGEIEITGTLGAQILVWEYATASPAACSASTRSTSPTSSRPRSPPAALLDARPEPDEARLRRRRHRGARHRSAASTARRPSPAAIDALLAAARPDDGYLAVQAYLDRVAHPELAELRDAARGARQAPGDLRLGTALPALDRPVPQGRPGGRRVPADHRRSSDADLEIPDRPFTFGQLIQAQAAGDASVLADHGRPVLTLTVHRPGTQPRAPCSHARCARSRMSPVEITPEFNPLRLPRRIADSTASPGRARSIIFGVTGDLSRKKLMPAVYDLANRGLLPPGFALVGFARRDWDDQDFDAGRARRGASSTRAPRSTRTSGSSSSSGIRFVQGEFDDDAAFDTLKETLARARPRPRHDGQPRVLPVDPAEVVPAGHRAAAATRASPSSRTARGAASSSRSRSAAT